MKLEPTLIVMSIPIIHALSQDIGINKNKKGVIKLVTFGHASTIYHAHII